MHYFDNSFNNGIDRSARSSARDASSAARNASTDVAILKDDVERLTMISEALWNFIKYHHNLTDEQLHNEIINVDLKDGKLDGKVGATAPQDCPHCHRVLLKNKPRCMYCGETVIQGPFNR